MLWCFGPFHRPKWQISLPFYILQLVKSLPFHIPEAWKRYPFRTEPPRIGYYGESPLLPSAALGCIFKTQNVLLFNLKSTDFFFVSIQGSKLKNEGINNEKSHGIALEPHHVWEYPCRALTQDSTIMTFDFAKSVPAEKIKTEGDIKILR